MNTRVQLTGEIPCGGICRRLRRDKEILGGITKPPWYPDRETGVPSVGLSHSYTERLLNAALIDGRKSTPTPKPLGTCTTESRLNMSLRIDPESEKHAGNYCSEESENWMVDRADTSPVNELPLAFPAIVA